MIFQVIISGKYDYSDERIQTDILDIIKKLENTTYIDDRGTDNWLSKFLSHVERNNQYDDTYFKDISTEENFIKELHGFYGPRIQDVDFSEDGKHIIGTRFMIQGTKIYDANQEKEFVEELRSVCFDASPYEVFVFHPYFIYFDQVNELSLNCNKIINLSFQVLYLISKYFAFCSF